jgi:N-acetylneuraminic acid mutarotase
LQAQTPGEIIAYAGNTIPGNSGDGGPALNAELNYPAGVALDKAGNVYIADSFNDCIRRVNASTGIITTVAGKCGVKGYSGDGGVATSAELSFPTGVALDSAGDLYIDDASSHVVRKVAASTGIITTVAGNGTQGYTGDKGPATSAELNPGFIALDPSGNLYISDTTDCVVRNVAASTGIISTIAGTGQSGYTGDGGAAVDALLSRPFGAAFDSAGNLYIADQGGTTIRKIAASTGVITTIAGNGVANFSGDGGLAVKAQLSGAVGLATDPAGNLYIADAQDPYNQRIRKIVASTGVIFAVAGNGFAGFSGNGIPAVTAELSYPQGIAVDSSNNFYIGDSQNQQVRKVFAGGPMQSVTNLVTPYYNVLAGQIFALNATVSGTLDAPAPTGTVTFYEEPAGTQAAIEIGAVQLDTTGQANFTLSLAAGQYLIWASYGGDQNYISSQSFQFGLPIVAVNVRAAAPYFTPVPGTYAYNLEVAINNVTPHLQIIYTTDGTNPSRNSGTVYKGSIPVTAIVAIKAIAIDNRVGIPPPQYADSPVSTATYVINLPSESPLPTGQWAWEGGGTTGTGCPYEVGAPATYGTLGVPAPGNNPGSRAPAAHWTDKSGNLWIFGGLTIIAPPAICPVADDLWMFNISTKEWTWMGGSTNYQFTDWLPAVYGTKGKFAPGNTPGSRESSAYWTDRAGYFWLFGGFGYASGGSYGYLNDLWQFNPSTRQWAWIAGSNVANQLGSYGTLHVANAGNSPGGRFGAAAWTDLRNNLWLFGGWTGDPSGKVGDINDVWEFEMSTRQWVWMGGSKVINQYGNYGTHLVPSTANIPGARDSAMTWVDALGKFWLFGGSGLGARGFGGTMNDLWEFNPTTLAWTWAAGSADSGTYPSPPPSSGTAPGKIGQIGVYDRLTVPDPGNTPGSRTGAATWTDAQGNLWLFGGQGWDSAGNYNYLNDLWEFDRAKWLWAWMGGSEIDSGSAGATVYGPYRVPSTQTQPGGRSGSAIWTDSAGNVWLFGGTAGDPRSTLITDYLNDLFEYTAP